MKHKKEVEITYENWPENEGVIFYGAYASIEYKGHNMQVSFEKGGVVVADELNKRTITIKLNDILADLIDYREE